MYNGLGRGRHFRNTGLSSKDPGGSSEFGAPALQPVEAHAAKTGSNAYARASRSNAKRDSLIAFCI